jgi:pyruvate formate lyase activating enzyme
MKTGSEDSKDYFRIKGFVETSFVDWPGRVCAVLFLPACNLRCPFCHNRDLVLHPEGLPSFPWEYINQRLETLRPWLDGVCVTGGEPTLQPELPDLLRKIRALGLAVKLDTNGTRPEVLRDLIALGLIDYLAMDVKGPLDKEAYRQCSGTLVSIGKIRQSMNFILSGTVPGEFRTTVVPQWHTPAVLARMALELKEAPRWTQQEFNPAQAMDPSLRPEGSHTQSPSH